MAITYGRNMDRLGVARQLTSTVMMRAYTTHNQQSDVFLSYQHNDQTTALALAKDLSDSNWDVYMDVHDDSLFPGDTHIDEALVEAIANAATMLIVVSDNTQGSWWVPWEIGVSTPSAKPRALYRPTAHRPLPNYLEKLERLQSPLSARVWLRRNR